MRKLISFATLAVLASGSLAFAADANRNAYIAPPANIPPAVVAPAWDGVYVGAATGYNYGGTTFNQSGSKDVRQRNGFVGHIYAGYNKTVAPNVVVGGEATLGLNGASRTYNRGATDVKSSETVDASLRGRVGYTQGQNMVYALAGPAIAGGKVSNSAGSDTATHVGVVVGAGVESQFTNNLVGRVEYTYTDYGSQTYTLGSTPAQVGLRDAQLTAGLGYKF